MQGLVILGHWRCSFCRPGCFSRKAVLRSRQGFHCRELGREAENARRSGTSARVDVRRDMAFASEQALCAIGQRLLLLVHVPGLACDHINVIKSTHNLLPVRPPKKLAAVGAHQSRCGRPINVPSTSTDPNVRTRSLPGFRLHVGLAHLGDTVSQNICLG